MPKRKMNNKKIQSLSIQVLQLKDVSFIQHIDLTNNLKWPLCYYFKSITTPCFYSYVARIGDGYVGSIMFRISMSVMYIDRILVDQSYRRAGIGARLLEEGLGVAKKENAEKALLTASINNIIALNFYLKNGFKVDNIRSDYYSKNEDGVRMKRLL
jgi:ribosomal protein S18 acetylase RimI-like enzyme